MTDKPNIHELCKLMRGGKWQLEPHERRALIRALFDPQAEGLVDFDDWIAKRVHPVRAGFEAIANGWPLLDAFQAAGKAAVRDAKETEGQPSLRPRGKPNPAGVYVYFLLCAEYVKIGSAAEITQRLTSLRPMAPWRMLMLGYLKGEPSLEVEMHKRWRHLHVRGEWFRMAPDLRQFIIEECHR